MKVSENVLPVNVLRDETKLTECNLVVLKICQRDLKHSTF